MAAPKDEEMGVLGAILRQLAKLDEPAKERVVKYLVQRVLSEPSVGVGGGV